jgi:hypothetical protein
MAPGSQSHESVWPSAQRESVWPGAQREFARVAERAARVRVMHRGVRHRLAGAPPRPGRARVRRQGLPALHRDPLLHDCRVPFAPRHPRLDRLVRLHQVVPERLAAARAHVRRWQVRRHRLPRAPARRAPTTTSAAPSTAPPAAPAPGSPAPSRAATGRAVSQPHRHQGRPARRLRVPAPRRDAQLQPAGLRHRRWRRRLLRPQLACRRFYELLAATAEALTDLRSTCRRQGPPRTAPSAASRRRPRAPWCPAPARPPPSRPIVAFSLGLGALKRGSQDDLTKTSTLQTGLLFGSEPERSSV